MSNGEEKQERIRERAYHIWLAEGQPEGRDKEHWELAKKLIEDEEQQHTPIPRSTP